MGLAIDNVINAARTFERHYNRRPSAIRMSRRTLDELIKQVPLIAESNLSESIYGIPFITDETVPLWSFAIELPKT